MAHLPEREQAQLEPDLVAFLVDVQVQVIVKARVDPGGKLFTMTFGFVIVTSTTARVRTKPILFFVPMWLSSFDIAGELAFIADTFLASHPDIVKACRIASKV